MIRPHPHIDAMAAYSLAQTQVPPGQRLISLAQNECLRPPSPHAVAAMQQACASALYPDPNWSALRDGLAELHALSPDQILCGAGSLELIAAIAQAFAGPSRSVLIPAHAYPFFATAAQMAGARIDRAPEDGFTVSADALLDSVKPDTGVLFVADPANPTGTHIPSDELRRLRSGLRDDILLVIDQAYGEYSPSPSIFDMAERLDTVILRSFSKAYGLASARVGWGVFPASVAEAIRKVLNPNNVSAASQAGACAALKDQAYMRETVSMTAELRETALKTLSAADIPAVPSATNFLLLPFDSEETANRVAASLAECGILLRAQGGVGLPHALRMTIGPETDLQAALDHLTGEGVRQ